MNSCHWVVTEFFEGKQFFMIYKVYSLFIQIFAFREMKRRFFFHQFCNDLHGFFYKQPSCYGSNAKNDLKVKQLAKQPPTLKVLMQKILVQLNSE